MHAFHASLALAFALAVALPATRATAADDAHHHGAGGAKLTLNHGKKWATDEPLRNGMQNIRAALAADLPAIHHGKLQAPGFDALAAKVSAEVASIVQNCKLDKAADEQLHLVIGQVLAGAEAMQGEEKGVTRGKGAERVAAALNQYGRYFAHPGWRAL